MAVVVTAVVTAACGGGSSGSTGAPVLHDVPAQDRPTAAEAATCAAHPASWMACLVAADPAFGELPLSGLALPGARDAGSFNLDPGSFDTWPGSACSAFRPQLGSESAAFARFSATQDESITAQLDDGVRFVDLDVAYNGTSEPTAAWRVTDSQYSEFPLFDYLDQVAEWARAHPHEVVILRLGRICYDNRPDSAEQAGLWTEFATSSSLGRSTVTLAKVAYDARQAPDDTPALATIDDVVGQHGGGHNVVVLLPASAVDLLDLDAEGVYPGVYPVSGAAVGPATRSGAVALTTLGDAPVAGIAPTTGSAVGNAVAALETRPETASPSLGSLVGKGFFVATVGYDFDGLSPAAKKLLFGSFGGLVVSDMPAHRAPLPAWESALWAERRAILEAWGHRATIVEADGVEHGGFVAAVIGLNAA